MKSYLSVIALMFCGVIGVSACSTPPSANDIANTIDKASIPTPRLLKTIDLTDLGSTSAVKKMTFSPDGRYLAIVDNPTVMKTDIVVWDMQLNKEQSHIHCPYDYGDLGDHDLLWSRNGMVISFGAKRQWNPMTGEALPDNPAVGRAARLNKDGSKMLTIAGAIGEPSYIYVYDTNNWALQKVYVDGFSVITAAWTAEDKVLVGVMMTKETFGKELDGRVVSHGEDTALRLLDPTGKTPTKTVWFPAKPTEDPKSFTYTYSIGAVGVTNFVTNQIFYSSGNVIDGDTLKIHRYSAYDQNDNAPGAFGMALSPNGRLLFLKGASFKNGGNHKPIKNSIVNVTSGKPLVEFSGAMDHQGGLAISPDGAQLALGDAHSVQIFSIR
ncbi:MAG: hypothetical protein JWP38_1681 [Herbaspirillum sp.]|nr:hypothetical protein [Herbaspirillum sp.]